MKLSDPNGQLIETGVTDPDKISCPICAKMWHKSNLRNHLFYGHHMKTTEVEHVLIKLKNPSIDHPKPEPAQTERTPCPKCDRSFKHWYNARRYVKSKPFSSEISSTSNVSLSGIYVNITVCYMTRLSK